MRVVSYVSSDDGLQIRMETAVQRVVLVDRESGARYDVPSAVSSEGEVLLLFTVLAQLLPSELARYDLLVSADEDDSEGDRVVVPGTRKIPMWQRYFRDSRAVASRVPHVYITLSGHLAVVMRSPTEIDFIEKNFRSDHKIREFSIRGRSMRFGFELEIHEKGLFRIERCFLKLESSDDLIELESNLLRQRGNEPMVAEVEVPIPKTLQLLPLRYSLYASVRDEQNNVSTTVKLTRVGEGLYRRLHEKLHVDSLSLPGGRVLVPSTNLLTSHLTFVVRESTRYDRDRFSQLVRGFSARSEAYVRRKLHISRKPMALIFEKEGKAAQDNGFALFSYLLQQEELPFDFRFVMDSDSPQRPRVQGMQKVVDKFSLAFWRLLASPSTFLVSSDTRFHLAHVYSQPDLLNKYLFVRKSYFLQHGVTGLKRVPIFDPRSAASPDYTVATSLWEKEILESAGVDSANIDITGFARWDRLHTEAVRKSRIRKILYMPTWRNWLEGRDAAELESSAYVQTLVEFLTSPELTRMLKEHECELQFVPHPKFKALSRIGGVANESISIADQDQIEFAELLRGSDAVITDYSSVLWDFVQSQKPVLLFQFDKARYDQEVGGFEHPDLDAVQTLFGSARTVSQMISEIQALLHLGADELDRDTAKVLARAFSYKDSDNCRRVVEAISARIGELTEARRVPGYEKADKLYQGKRQLTRDACKEWSNA